MSVCGFHLFCLGVMRSLTDSFKAIRGSRIDRFVIETNKLLIRLDKLVSADVNMDPGKRKGQICSWAENTFNFFYFCILQQTVLYQAHSVSCRCCCLLSGSINCSATM